MRVTVEERAPLNSVGLVCTCGKALATIEGVARRCECGRVWLVTAMLLAEPSCVRPPSRVA